MTDEKNKEYYLTQKKDNNFLFSDVKILNIDEFSNLFNPIKKDILSLLSKRPMYPIEIAKKLKLHEQKVYYHIKPLIKNNLIEVKEKKEIRGTIAKKYFCPISNFTLSLNNLENIDNWRDLDFYKTDKDNKLLNFFDPLISKNSLNGYFVVGSPDPHGEFKAYSRDGHYAIDLAFSLGNNALLKNDFSVKLDVDVKKEDLNNNLLLIGGPVTNMVVSSINSYLPVKFIHSKLWGLKSFKTNKEYIDDTIGLIAKIENPFNPKNSLFILAGIRAIGTKACVLALTRYSEKLLNTYFGQKEWYAIVQGFDLDGDGKIDSIEILE